MPSDLIEKLRQERQERDKQRKAELDKLEKDLAARREQRKAERQMTREKERKSEIAMRNLTIKAIEDSFKKVELNNLTADLKRREFESKQNALKVKREADKEIFEMKKQRMKELALKRKQKKIPPRPKRYNIQPVEFYGIDFSVDANIDERQKELYDLSRKREEEMVQNPQVIDSYTKVGNAFVKALAETTAMDHNRVEHLLREKRGTGYSSTVQEGGDKKNSSSFSSSKKPEKKSSTVSDDDFVNSLKDLTYDPSKMAGQTKGTSESFYSKKKWTEQIKRNNAVDYSEYFPANIALKEGIRVFRIEDLKPVEIAKANVGKFCVGDAYIVLSSTNTKDGKQDFQIHQWTGDEASLDKLTASAFYSVGLKEMLNVQSKIVRVESGNENKQFVNTFYAHNYDYKLLDASHAAETALFSVQEHQYPLLMYRVGCNRVCRKTIKGESPEESKVGDLVLELEELNVSKLCTGYVYIIDAGLTLYQWNGKDSALGDRIQASFFANRIVRNERTLGKAELFEIDEGNEPEEFWDIFDGEKRDSDKASKEIEKTTIPSLYIFTPEVISEKIAALNVSAYLAQAPKESKKHKNLPSLPKRESLDSKNCAVLDCGNELYLWTGRKSTLELREVVEQIVISKIFPLKERKSFCLNSKQMEGVENEAFKARFTFWEISSRKVDFSECKATFARSNSARQSSLIQKEVGIKIDIQALYSPAYTGKTTPQEDEAVNQMFTKANALLKNIQCFVFDRSTNTFIRLPDYTIDGSREKGHFWSQETYVFLCIYKKEEQKTEEDIMFSISSANMNEPYDNVVNYECATYLWQGRHSGHPSFAQLTFQFQFKKVLQDLVSHMSEGQIEMKTVILDQEKESLAFLAHIDKECIIHFGARPSKFTSLIPRPMMDVKKDPNDVLNPENVLMYHVRTDPKYKITRAVQVAPMVTSLCTRDIYIIMYTGKNGLDPNTESNTFVWIGKGASKEEERRATSIVNKLVALRMEPPPEEKKLRPSVSAPPQLYTIIKEKSEPSQFWSLLAPTFDKPTSPIPYGQGFYYSTPLPRIFRCSTESGIFQIQDLSSFTVNDLKSDSVCLLDSGPGLGKPNILWAWIGNEASDVVIKLAKKSCDAYFDHLKDGRSLDRSEWDTSEKTEKEKGKIRETVTGVLRCDLLIAREGSEPVEFKAFFLGWGDTYKIDKIKISSKDYEKLLEKMSGCVKKEEPSNEFMRAEMKKREEYRKKKASQQV